MEFLPIDIEVLHEDQLDCLIVEGTMNRDFGPWKVNDCHVLTFNFESGTVIEHDDNGKIMITVNIEIKIKE